MHVRKHLDARKFLKFLPGEGGRRLYKTDNFEFPFVQVDLRGAEGIKHRPLAGANLPRRQAILSQSVGTNDDLGAEVRRRRYLVGL